MKEKVLLTGGSGQLGMAIKAAGKSYGFVHPTHAEMDISNIESVRDFFHKNDFDAVIHCAAMARMKICEKNPDIAIEVNVIGTANLVMETIRKEKDSDYAMRFVHISTDGVYPGTTGNYSELSETIPFNKYCWSKLGAECSVNLLANHCIIRTNFFDPDNIPFDTSADDIYTSKVPRQYLARAVLLMLENDFTGTINVGGQRHSDYDAYRKFKPSLKPCKHDDIQRDLGFSIYKDSSMDTTLWKRIAEQEGFRASP